MADLTTLPLQDNYQSTLSQSRNGAVGTIYVNTPPSFTFPAGKKCYIVVNPEKSNMQVARISAYNASAKTITVDSITVDKGNGVAYTQQSHAVWSKVMISDSYQFREDLATAIDSKVDTNSDDTATGKFADATARDAYFTSPVNWNTAYLTSLWAWTDYIGGAWSTRATWSVVNASTTVAGKVEKATSWEVTAWTSTGWTGAELFVWPAELKTVTDALAANNIISVYFGNWSDGNVTISSWTTTLTKDMYYNNLTITSPWVLDPNWYRIFVKWTLSGNGTIRRNGNNWTAGGTRPSWNNPWTAWTLLNQWSLNMEVAWGNGWARSSWAAAAWTAWTSASPSMTNINGVAWGNNWSWTGAGAAWTATRWTLYNIYWYPQSLHLATASATFAGLQYLSIPWSWGWAWSAGSWWVAQWAWGWAWGNGWFIRLVCYIFNFTWTVSATWGNWWAWGTSAWWWGWGNGGIFFRVYHTLSNDCTKTLTWWAWWAGWAAWLLPAWVAGTAGNAWETITITI